MRNIERPEPDSNRRMTVLQTVALANLAIGPQRKFFSEAPDGSSVKNPDGNFTEYGNSHYRFGATVMLLSLNRIISTLSAPKYQLGRVILKLAKSLEWELQKEPQI